MPTLKTDLALALPDLNKAVFSQPTAAALWTKLSIRPVKLKGRLAFQTEGIRDNKAYHQNLDEQALLRLFDEELDGRYRQVLITTGSEASQYVLKRDGSYKRSARALAARPASSGDTAPEGQPENHNRQKSYLLSEGENIPALVDLGVFTPDFRIVKAKYNKYRQINRFIQLIDDEFAASARKDLTILDFGCGKSYLTFIMYYYFTVKRGMDVRIIGYDLKADVVEHCNALAARYGYDKLRFVVADVTKDKLYDEHIDMVVTLHACDTATDYALYYAIQKQADYIFSVPCCQHEINSQIKKAGELDIFLRHGIVKERMCALLTDSIRAAALEDMGYRTDMIEFVDMEHSPKNIMLRARRVRPPRERELPACRALAEKYGFQQTLLTLLDQFPM